VGTEHAQWLEEDISAPGVAMLRALFEGVDPGGNLNPGKIVDGGRARVDAGSGAHVD
jgi:alkyldihydroxyacetonephosphate synthase